MKTQLYDLNKELKEQLLKRKEIIKSIIYNIY